MGFTLVQLHECCLLLKVCFLWSELGSNGWSSTNVAILVGFFSVYMTKLHETQASELSIDINNK